MPGPLSWASAGKKTPALRFFKKSLKLWEIKYLKMNKQDVNIEK